MNVNIHLHNKVQPNRCSDIKSISWVICYQRTATWLEFIYRLSFSVTVQSQSMYRACRWIIVKCNYLKWSRALNINNIVKLKLISPCIPLREFINFRLLYRSINKLFHEYHKTSTKHVISYVKYVFVDYRLQWLKITVTSWHQISDE